MALSTYFYDPFYDPFFTVSVPNITRELTHDDTSTGAQGVMRPKMDLHSSKDTNKMTATFELPGLKKDDVNIEVHNNRLVVSGESALSEHAEKEGYAVRERRFGRFSRTLPLPDGTKSEDIKAHLDHGVLTVNFPKSQPEQEVKKITVS